MKEKKLTYIIVTLIFFVLIFNLSSVLANNIQNIENDYIEMERLEKGDINIGLEKIADGFNSPVVLTHPGDGTNRVFVADQTGIINVI